MSYFEAVGVDYQYNATSIFDAKNKFKKSCTICCTTGKHLDCDKCHIASAHNNIIIALSTKH